jgi:hypothetical protein
MAFWLWLENIGFPSLVLKLASFPLITINYVAQEASSCLKCLESDNFSILYNGGLLLTQTIMEREIPLLLFQLRRYTIIADIQNVLNNTCARIFNDILLTLKSTCVSKLVLPYPYYRPMIVSGFPHSLFGEFNNIPPTNFESHFYLVGQRIWENRRLFDDVADEDKTIFLTFSRGFPVTREEVRYLFTKRFGVYCIKDMRMGSINSDGQILYATIVVNNVETFDRILKKRHVAKFHVNGKHIWARKYERRK